MQAKVGVKMLSLKKQDDENDEQFIWRICQYKDSGITDMSWDEVADVLNRELGMDDMPYAASSFRKLYQQAKRFYDAGVFDCVDSKEIVDQIRIQRNELEKERVKVRDERNELRRMLREEARKESFKEQIVREIAECECKPLEYDINRNFNGVVKGDNDLVVTLTDLHTGIHIDNFCNKFNGDVLKIRLNKYIDKILEIQKRHGSENAFVVISEVISGLIHDSLRIESNHTIIEQFLTATNYISEFLAEISNVFNEVNVFCCPGNHSRVVANKNNSLKGENIDNLVIPFLEAKLQNFNNIHCYRNEIEESVAIFDVRGNVVMASHGDKDEPSSVVQKFTMMFDKKPSIVYLSHRHANAMSTIYDTKVITSGCLSGPDNYCMDKRLRGKPEQVVSVITKDGLDCNYDVTL